MDRTNRSFRLVGIIEKEELKVFERHLDKSDITFNYSFTVLPVNILKASLFSE
ncbi:MAG: hypothetical protein WAZ77_24190 [Candidatus Nitrosopolaris sp.]